MGDRSRVTDFLACADFGDDETLRLIASAERGSDHPLASAVVEAARERGLALSEPADVDHAAGYGVHARVDGHDVWVGDLSYTRERGWQEAPLGTLDRYAREGKTPLLAAIDGKPGAILAVADDKKE
jgi:Cu+-exporting ATPase